MNPYSPLYITQRIHIMWNGIDYKGFIEAMGHDWLVIRPDNDVHVKVATGHGIIGYFEREIADHQNITAKEE